MFTLECAASFFKCASKKSCLEADCCKLNILPKVTPQKHSQ